MSLELDEEPMVNCGNCGFRTSKTLMAAHDTRDCTPMSLELNNDIDRDKQDIISSVANDYYDSLKNEAPYINMKFEELGAVCRDLATQDLESLIARKGLDSRKQAFKDMKAFMGGNTTFVDHMNFITASIAELSTDKGKKE